MTLLFGKKDDVHLKLIKGERSDEKLLSERFTFKVEGAEFTPAFRNRYWDGKIRLYNSTDKTIYFGLYFDLIKFSKETGVSIQFDGPRSNFPGKKNIDDELISGFLKTLNPHSNGKPITIRDYQQAAFKSAISTQRCLLLSPTASGKSLIIYSLVQWWRQVHNRRILIIVPTVGLVTQMISDFQDYSNGSFNDIQGIQAGETKEVSSRVVVSTWQSIYKQPLSWYAQFGSVVVDEVHTAQAKSLQNIMKKLLVCPDRVGLTGTLQDTKTHELVLKGLFGPIHKVITTKELMDNNSVSQMKINITRLKYNSYDRRNLPNNYQSEMTFLINHKKRNDYICKLAEELKGNTLVIFQRIEHGKEIFNNIKTNKQLFYVSGETDKDTREITRKMAEENDVIIVASLGVFSTGINIKNLHNLVLAHPTKSKIKVLQSIGRILRKSENKSTAMVYDIVDDLKHYSRKNYALRHAGERFKYYKKEKFELILEEIEFDD